MKLHAPYHEACDTWHEPGDCPRNYEDEPFDAFADAPLIDDQEDTRCICGVRARIVGQLCDHCFWQDGLRGCENCGGPSVGAVCTGCANDHHNGGL